MASGEWAGQRCALQRSPCSRLEPGTGSCQGAWCWLAQASCSSYTERSWVSTGSSLAPEGRGRRHVRSERGSLAMSLQKLPGAVSRTASWGAAIGSAPLAPQQNQEAEV